MNRHFLILSLLLGLIQASVSFGADSAKEAKTEFREFKTVSESGAKEASKKQIKADDKKKTSAKDAKNESSLRDLFQIEIEKTKNTSHRWERTR